MNWRNFPEVVNSIINEMLLSWKDLAYLLYHVFAGIQLIKHSLGCLVANINVAKGLLLSNIARLSVVRRKTFVSGVINELKKLPPPSRIEGAILFNPTISLSVLLPSRRYDFPTIKWQLELTLLKS